MATRVHTNADELIAFIENGLKTGPLETPPPLLDPYSKYRAFVQLWVDWKRYGPDLELVQKIHQSLLKNRTVAAFFHVEAHKRFLMHLIWHHIILAGNASGQRMKLAGVGNNKAFYTNLVAHYFNHSCYPNVCMSLENGIMSCTVIRPVKKDEQLFVNYYSGRYDFEEDRQAMFKEDFNFNCKCEVCRLKSLSNNVAMRLDPLFAVIKSMFRISDLEEGEYDRDQIKLIKNMCFNYLKQYGRSKWCIETGEIIIVLSILSLQNPTVDPFSKDEEIERVFVSFFGI